MTMAMEKDTATPAINAFAGNPRKNRLTGLPFELSDYIPLVDLTGRCIRADKSGYIDNAQPEILTGLGISPENWLVLTTQFGDVFMVGR